VTLTYGGTVEYTRSADTYIKRNDGTLDIFHGGAKRSQSYASGQWADVHGNEKSARRSFLGLGKPSPVSAGAAAGVVIPMRRDLRAQAGSS
jgi:hypothetical protein